MPYTLTSTVNHKVEISARIDSDVVSTERQGIVRAISHRVQMPGFRPGKAPRRMVEQRFAQQIEEELTERLEGMMWHEIVDREDSFRPLAAPRVISRDFADDGAFELTAEVEVRPSYDLPDFATLDLPEVSLEVADSDVSAELARVREQYASWEPADDKEATDGMLVEADLHGEMEGSEEEPYNEEGARFVLGEEGVPDEVNEALQGARAGDEREATRDFPDDDDNEARAGKTVRYRVKVRALKEKVLPPVDDDLARTVGLESLAELEERIRSSLGRQKVNDRRNTWRRSLLEQASTDIDLGDLPPTLVQNAVREELSRLAYSMALQGLKPDEQNVDWQEMAARFEPQARRKVLDSLILEQLAEAWQVDVPENEVDAYIASEASSRGIPAAEHKANLAKEDKLDDIRHAARISATVDEMIRRAGGEVE
jgi:trigger factor